MFNDRSEEKANRALGKKKKKNVYNDNIYL